jgi:hypothetical protein
VFILNARKKLLNHQLILAVMLWLKEVEKKRVVGIFDKACFYRQPSFVFKGNLSLYSSTTECILFFYKVKYLSINTTLFQTFRLLRSNIFC